MEVIKAIKHQIGKIGDAIVTIMEDNAMTGRTVAEGNEITRNIYNFKFLCGLVLWHDILFEINVVSKRLQGVDLDISGTMINWTKRSHNYSLTGQMRDFKTF